MFIELEDENGTTIFVNTVHYFCKEKGEKYTYINVDDCYFSVKETPEEIMKKIKKALGEDQSQTLQRFRDILDEWWTEGD